MSGESPQTTVPETRRLAAIMFTDIVGFSQQRGANEARMLRLLEVHNRIIQHAVAEHHGTVIKTVGDAFLVDFPSVVHAVQCAQLDRLEEAKAAGTELQRLNPAFSLERWKQIAPFKDPALLERDLTALRKAGVK